MLIFLNAKGEEISREEHKQQMIEGMEEQKVQLEKELETLKVEYQMKRREPQKKLNSLIRDLSRMKGQKV